MKVYLASSWRNPRQPDVVLDLRKCGYDVYDFRNPAPGDTGFGWRQCADAEQLKDGRRFRDEVLTSPIARNAFAKDMGALRGADATVLLLPCGRSAHLELGYATGAGQRTIVLLDDPMSEPELMYLMNSAICTSVGEVVDALDHYSAMIERGEEHVRCEACVVEVDRRRARLCPEDGTWLCPPCVMALAPEVRS